MFRVEGVGYTTGGPQGCCRVGGVAKGQCRGVFEWLARAGLRTMAGRSKKMQDHNLLYCTYIVDNVE